MSNTIGTKINDYIKQNGIKKAHLYRGMGISRTTLTLKLKGQVEFTISEFTQICRLLRVDPKKFMEVE